VARPTEEPSRAELEAAHCWEPGDRVPGRPATTAFRRRARLHQADWRDAHGHPIGTQPIRPRPGDDVRLVGSRLALDHAIGSGANFVTPGALAAARERMATKEPHQVLSAQRVWADLLWSESMAFNLFGDLAADLGLADRAVHAWWPDAPGRVVDVRFAHSPGRLDLDYLGNLSTFEAAFVLEADDGSLGIVAVAARYHEFAKREVPKPSRRARYLQVAERSGAFLPEAVPAVDGTGLLVTWLGHLLVLSMLQHPRGDWGWGRFVMLHPAANPDFVDAAARYGALLADDSTFGALTLEQLLAADVLPARSAAAIEERYVVP
jgi:hypothetical protein